VNAVALNNSSNSAGAFTVGAFGNSNDVILTDTFSGTYTPPDDVIKTSVSETANDGSAPNAYVGLLSTTVVTTNGNVTVGTSIDIPKDFWAAHVGTTINFQITQLATNGLPGDLASNDGTAVISISWTLQAFDPLTIANDHLGITRTVLPSADATAEAKAIDQFKTTETQYVNDLLAQVANTTFPAVAVEGSMYGAVGSSDEVTKLATLFLPGQVDNALKNGFDPQVYACEALGLAFARTDENGGTAFAQKFGPTAPGMAATPDGDAFFAKAAATAIFGAAATGATPGVILDWVSNWVDFYTSHGVPGLSNPTNEVIHLVARGAAWGDAVGVALGNNLGPLVGQTTNFLECAAQGTAVYGASLANQPVALPFEGEIDVAQVQLLGVVQQTDHIVM
jgi:hypothetical protein